MEADPLQKRGVTSLGICLLVHAESSDEEMEERRPFRRRRVEAAQAGQVDDEVSCKAQGTLHLLGGAAMPVATTSNDGQAHQRVCL